MSPRQPSRGSLSPVWAAAVLRARGLLVGSWPSLTLVTTGLSVSGCAQVFTQAPDDATHPSLAEQEREGWSVGEEGRPLVFPDAQSTDVAGGTNWRESLTTMASRLAPSEAGLLPYYDPTLFQSLSAPRSESLRLAMLPILTASMAGAARRGAELLSLFIQEGRCRSDVAIVLDLPGPEAVAVAAELAPCFDPVFVFDNWPHPLGVVASHLTLAASVYYLPSLEAARKVRPPGAAPVLVLDRLRLAPYTDDGGRFDNRYFVGLPPAATFESAGIRRLLYVIPDDRNVLESDDLNDDLVALVEGGVEVKMLALSDFAEAPPPGWPNNMTVATPAPFDGDAGMGDAAPGPGTTSSPRFYFGGSARSHGCFWSWYGWPVPGQDQAPCPPPPQGLLPRSQFRPIRRPTFFSGPPGAQPGTGAGWPAGGGGAIRHGGSTHAFGTFHHPYANPPAGRSGSVGRSHFGGHSG